MAWTMSASIGARVVTTLGTVLLTYFITPDVMGEVASAAILMVSAHQFSILGVPQFLITREELDRHVTWHATLMVVGTGLLAIGGAVLLRDWIAALLEAPSVPRYLPLLACSVMMQRLGVIPERLLQRDLRFREVSVVRGVSEMAYTAFAVGLAMQGFGGMAIVGGNLARGILYLGLMVRHLPLAQWVSPHPLSGATFKAILRFGVPVQAAVIFGLMSRTWDNLLMLRMFGPAVAGAYGQAYNLADIPAVQVGEQIGDVLTPSFVKVPPEQRPAALIRSTALLSLVVFPLAIGLGAVAETLTSTFLAKSWAAVGPMLTVLSALAVVRPLGWTIFAYLQTVNRLRTALCLSIVTAVVLFPAMYLLGRSFGPLAACAGVGVAFAANAIVGMWAVARVDRAPMSGFILGFARPLLSCAPMVLAVLGARWGLAAAHIQIRGLNLAIEVLAGGAAYVAGAFVLARPIALDFLKLVRGALRRKR